MSIRSLYCGAIFSVFFTVEVPTNNTVRSYYSRPVLSMKDSI